MPDTTGSTQLRVTNRPDVIKWDVNYRNRLNKAELKGTFFKFLLQAGVPFTPKQVVGIPTAVNIDRLLKNSVKKDEEPLTKLYHNLSKITIACQLDGVYIDDAPVFVELRYKNYEEMGNRERNRLIAIQQKINLITFFHDDFVKVGVVKSEGSPFIPPMNRRTLKRWANLLFDKIRKLEGDFIEIPYSLTDLKASIDEHTAEEGNIIKTLKLSNRGFRKQLIKNQLEKTTTLSKTHEKILDNLVSINSESLTWVDKIIHKISDDFIFSIDLRTKKYKEVFTQKNGTINPANKNLLTNYILKSINQKLPTCYATLVSDNVLQVCNATTLQSFYLLLNITQSQEIRYVKLPQDFFDGVKKSLVFTLTAHYDSFNKCSKPVETSTGVLLTDNYNTKNNFTRNYILFLSKSTRTCKKYIKWAV